MRLVVYILWRSLENVVTTEDTLGALDTRHAFSVKQVLGSEFSEILELQQAGY